MSTLPEWGSVLAIVAHPDDESFGLGAVLSAFADSGARVHVLCFTRGEASTLHAVTGDLATLRADELRSAAAQLGIVDVRLLAFPDGGLAGIDHGVLLADALAYAAEVEPDGLIAFDPSGVTGHPDHRAATAVAAQVATMRAVGMLGWTVPDSVARALNSECGSSFSGHAPGDIDITLTVDRTHQRAAVDCHPSQAVPGSVLWRRLDLLGRLEHLRWLHHAPQEGPS
ncbi:MAG: PIG-L deacetylase family protein [Actinomycetota bacterium]|nr:PIG-L deacetylase family protein [Actinomycetota bacterium]